MGLKSWIDRSWGARWGNQIRTVSKLTG